MHLLVGLGGAGRGQATTFGRQPSLGSLGLYDLGEHFVVVSLELLALGVAALLGRNHGPLALQALRGDEALDLRGLEGVLLAFPDDFALDDVLTHVVALGEKDSFKAPKIQ